MKSAEVQKCRSAEVQGASFVAAGLQPCDVKGSAQGAAACGGGASALQPAALKDRLHFRARWQRRLRAGPGDRDRRGGRCEADGLIEAGTLGERDGKRAVECVT